MKKIILCLIFFSPVMLTAQFGVKAGFNYANITEADDISNSARSGFHAGVFLAGSSKSLLSSRTELLFSKQGYEFKTNTNTGVVNLNYLLLPQFMAINITKFFQIQVGGQIAYLLNATVDSTSVTGDPTTDDILALMNRFDYGLGGGLEVHPFHFLIVGARINIGLGSLYKVPEPGEDYSFVPEIDVKNNLFQIYTGYKFGKKEVKQE